MIFHCVAGLNLPASAPHVWSVESAANTNKMVTTKQTMRKCPQVYACPK